MDDCGLRYVQLDVADMCVNLGELLNQLGVGLQAPEVITLCNPYVRYVPNCAGESVAMTHPSDMPLRLACGTQPHGGTQGHGACTAAGCRCASLECVLPPLARTLCMLVTIPTPLAGSPTFTLEDGTVLSPSATVAFTMSIPDLNIENVRAVFSYEGVGAGRSFSMQVGSRGMWFGPWRQDLAHKLLCQSSDPSCILHRNCQGPTHATFCAPLQRPHAPRETCPMPLSPFHSSLPLVPSFQLLGSFSILNDLATVSDMVISDVSAGSFTASLRLTVPDLNMVGALATLSYSSATRTFTFQVRAP